MEPRQEKIKDPVVTAVFECLEEVISCLCYQPDIPLQHKTDMVNKLLVISKAYYSEEVNDH